jgi:predicted phosphodiesterase
LVEFAVISDIHSNLEALSAVLFEIKGMDVYCLGDLVDYGANPNEVVDEIRKRKVVCILGNHDQAAITGDASMMNQKAALSSEWTTRNLTAESLSYLKRLPFDLSLEVEGTKAQFYHGSPDDPLWEYVDPSTHGHIFGHYLARLGVGLIGLGHTHVSYVWKDRRGIVFNPGSVGQPRDGDRRASYALLTDQGGDIEVQVRRVEYDFGAAAAKIRAAGLPVFFADRLYSGT